MASNNIVFIGDHRDIPLALGMLTINWNNCEGTLRQLLRELITKNDLRSWRLADPLISELTSVGIAQAINCYAAEFPPEFADISDALKHATSFLERARSYRNYYIHGIRAITQYGFIITDEGIENDTPLHETMFEGPFGNIHTKTAKHKLKNSMDFITKDELFEHSNGLAGFNDYLLAVSSSIRAYLRGADYREIAPLPPLVPLPNVLVKPDLNHPKLRRPYALALNDRKWGGEEED